MNLTGSYTFDAPIEKVFDTMTDPQVVASCLPGCERLEPLGDNKYKAMLSIGIAAFTSRYEGIIELQDRDRPSSYKLSVEGKSKTGFVKGQGEIRLSTTDSGQTTVDFSGTAQIGGALASVGQRFIGGASKMMTDKFFGCLESKLAG